MILPCAGRRCFVRPFDTYPRRDLCSKAALRNKSGILGTSFDGFARVWLSGFITCEKTYDGHGQISLWESEDGVTSFSAGVQSFTEVDCERSVYGVGTTSVRVGSRNLYATRVYEPNSIRLPAAKCSEKPKKSRRRKRPRFTRAVLMGVLSSLPIV